MKDSRTIRLLLLAVALMTSIVTLPGVSPAQVSGKVAWNGWAFTYEVSGSNDGLSIKGVTFQGFPFIYELSFPVVRVFYD